MKNLIIKIVILYFLNYIKNIYKIKNINIDNQRQIKLVTLKQKYKNILIHNLSIIHEIFKHLNIVYFVSNDLLLSYIKDNKTIPNIDKIDIYIQKNTFDKLKLLPYLENNQLELNMSIANYSINSLKLPSSIRYRINIQLHFFEIKNEKLYYIENNLLNTKKEICHQNKIFPLQTIRAYKIDMFIPFDYDTILTYHYGNDYLNYNLNINKKHPILKNQMLQYLINLIK